MLSELFSNIFKTVTGKKLASGIIAVIQTFGEKINLHLHLHILVTEGSIDEEKYSQRLLKTKA